MSFLRGVVAPLSGDIVGVFASPQDIPVCKRAMAADSAGDLVCDTVPGASLSVATSIATSKEGFDSPEWLSISPVAR